MSEQLYSTDRQEWTFEVNGYHRTLNYWTYPLLYLAWRATEDHDDPFVLMVDDSEDLWIKAGDDVEFHVPPRDPRFPQRATQKELDEFQEFGLYRNRQGYGVVHIYGNDVAFEDPRS